MRSDYQVLTPESVEFAYELAGRYRAIGGSPLAEITQGQAEDLSRSLGIPTFIGFKHAPPFVADGAAAAREAGYAAHPAVIALAHRHDVLLDTAGGATTPPLASADLTQTQRAGLVELVMTGDKPGDWAVSTWYQASGTERERPMAAGNLSEAARRRDLARAMLKADGTLHGPAVEICGREFVAGERIVVGPRGIPSVDLDPGVPGRVEQVDPGGEWIEVDFPTAGHYRWGCDGPEAFALNHGYAEIIVGASWLRHCVATRSGGRSPRQRRPRAGIVAASARNRLRPATP